VSKGRRKTARFWIFGRGEGKFAGGLSRERESGAVKKKLGPKGHLDPAAAAFENLQGRASGGGGVRAGLAVGDIIFLDWREGGPGALPSAKCAGRV